MAVMTVGDARDTPTRTNSTKPDFASVAAQSLSTVRSPSLIDMSSILTPTTRSIPRILRGIPSRSIASSSRRYNESQGDSGGPTKDPSHPYLYYHPSPSNQSTILSFLPTPPSQGSSTILGHLPTGGSLEHFKEGPKFLYASVLRSSFSIEMNADGQESITCFDQGRAEIGQRGDCGV